MADPRPLGFKAEVAQQEAWVLTGRRDVRGRLASVLQTWGDNSGSPHARMSYIKNDRRILDA